MTIASIVLSTGLILVLIGIWGMLTQRNILRLHRRLHADGDRQSSRHRCHRLCQQRDGAHHRWRLEPRRGAHTRGRPHTLGARGDGNRHRPGGDRRHAGLCDRLYQGSTLSIDAFNRTGNEGASFTRSISSSWAWAAVF